MADFFTGGPRDMVIAWTTDGHMRLDEPRYTNLQASIPQLITSMKKNPFDLHIESGDMLEGDTGTPGTRGNFTQQSALYQMIRDGLDAPAEGYVMGNHDIAGASAGFTKANVKAFFGMPGDYYYQDYGTWRIIYLYGLGLRDDEFQQFGLGLTQLAWLSSLLSVSSAYKVLIVSHLPALSFTAMTWYTYEYEQSLATSAAWNPTVDMLGEQYPILELIRTNSCVKGFISGHDHLIGSLHYPPQPHCQHFSGGSIGARYWNIPYEWQLNYRCHNRLTLFKNGNISREVIYY